MFNKKIQISELKYIEKILRRQTEVARCLGVTSSTVSRWMKGKDKPNDRNEERIIALCLVIIKLRAIYEDNVILDWLSGMNTFLNNHRPKDFIINGRMAEVFAAIDQTRAGSFA